MIFLKFFATFLSGYRNFLVWIFYFLFQWFGFPSSIEYLVMNLANLFWCQENSATQVFNTQAFLKKRSRSTNQPSEPMVILGHNNGYVLQLAIMANSNVLNDPYHDYIYLLFWFSHTSNSEDSILWSDSLCLIYEWNGNCICWDLTTARDMGEVVIITPVAQANSWSWVWPLSTLQISCPKHDRVCWDLTSIRDMTKVSPYKACDESNGIILSCLITTVLHCLYRKRNYNSNDD
jgi:hypothetical protein